VEEENKRELANVDSPGKLPLKWHTMRRKINDRGNLLMKNNTQA